jgi:hypothetical protein
MRRPRLNHRAHELHGRQLIGSTVNQITDEHRRALRMAPSAGVLAVAQQLQKSHQLAMLPLHIADQVKLHESRINRYEHARDRTGSLVSGALARRQTDNHTPGSFASPFS